MRDKALPEERPVGISLVRVASSRAVPIMEVGHRGGGTRFVSRGAESVQRPMDTLQPGVHTRKQVPHHEFRNRSESPEKDYE